MSQGTYNKEKKKNQNYEGSRVDRTLYFLSRLLVQSRTSVGKVIRTNQNKLGSPRTPEQMPGDSINTIVGSWNGRITGMSVGVAGFSYFRKDSEGYLCCIRCAVFCSYSL